MNDFDRNVLQQNEEAGENPDEEMEFPWQDVLELTNGRDAVGDPFASAVISVDQILEDDQLKTLQNIYFNDAEFQIRMSGGCIAMYADMPKKSRSEFLSIKKLCNEWFEKLNEPSFENEILTMTIVPLLLEGNLYIVLNHLILADGYETEDGYRLLFAFDNMQTTPVVNAEIDFATIVTEIDAELQRKETELLNSIEEAERIIAESEVNPFDVIMKERLNNPLNTYRPDNNSETVNSGIRVTREDQDE